MSKKDAMLATVDVVRTVIEQSEGDVLGRVDEVTGLIEAVYAKVAELTEEERRNVGAMVV